MWNLLSCMETGTPYMKYDMITILPDGPKGIRQITLGVGFTEFGGNLKKVVQLYVNKKGIYADKLSPFVDKIGKIPLVNDASFVELLKIASKKDGIMMDCQDTIFEEKYFTPAMKWAHTEGFKTNLAILCIFDSFLQSGQIFGFLRNRFSEKTPRNGGDEKKWITEYIIARQQWLKTHSNRAVRNSAYRTQSYLKIINNNNWDLLGVIKTDNGCSVI